MQIYVYKCTEVFVYFMCAYACVFAQVYIIYTSMSGSIRYIHLNMCAYMYIDMYLYTYVCVYIYTYLQWRYAAFCYRSLNYVIESCHV